MTTTFAPGQPCWIDMSVPDASTREAVMAFLGRVFDWTFEVGSPETGFYTMAMLDGAPVAALMAQPEGAGVWVTYFATDDIDGSVARITDAGGQVFMGPMQVMASGSMALAMDPTGAVFGLWQKDDFAGFGAVWQPNAPSWFDHQSPSPAEASAFYTRVLELDLTPAGPEGGGMLGRGETMYASISQSPEAGMASYWNPVIGVTSIDSVQEQAVALGATSLMERMAVPGGFASAFAAPGTGTVITIFETDGPPLG